MIMIYRIYQSNLAECILEKLFLLEHIREAAAPYFYEYRGRHQLYSSIEQGKTHVYGCFAGREFRGIILGRRLPDGYFYAHFFLLRGKDGWKFKNPAEDAIAADYEAEGIPLAGLMGCIPEKNRAMIMAICRANRADGIRNVSYQRENGYFIYRRKI